MALFKHKRKNRCAVGIEMSTEGLALAVTEAGSECTAMRLIGFDAAGGSLQDLSAIGADLATLVESESLHGQPCHLVLARDDYQLLLVEAPEVPDEELKEALRWRIKDLTSIALDKAAIDVFVLPADGSRAGKKMVYVVVTEMQRLARIRDLVLEAGLALESIDIAELALRNLTLLKTDEAVAARGQALVRLAEGSGTVSIYKQGNLYLSRQFQLNYGAGLLDDLPTDSLALEIQRSLDYYERQMGQAQPARLLIGGENVSADKIDDALQQALPAPAEWLSAAALLTLADGVDDGVAQQCLAALGASVRDSVVR